MSYKRLIAIGDSHFRGDGAEWPKLYGHLGPIPKEYKTNFWLTKIKKGFPDKLPELYNEFYSNLKPNIERSSNFVLEYRDKFSFIALLGQKMDIKPENYCLKTDYVKDILPFFKLHCEDTNFKDTLVLCGIPPAAKNLNYLQQGQKLANITILNLAANIVLLKEFVENRGGHFMYMHTEDYPVDLYNPTHNPYLIDLLPLLLHQGDLSSMLSQSYTWRKYDGKHYDAGAQKEIANIIYSKLVV